ncbi:MAG: nitrite reductase small subunit NirD [Pseudomonadota bacterium]
MQYIPVCNINELVPCRGAAALVDGQQVAVFRLPQGSIYAIGNHDPFSGANVLSRGIVGDLKGELVVASPIYKQHFSLVSGRCLEDDSISVPVYPVRTLKNVVEIGTRPILIEKIVEAATSA